MKLFFARILKDRNLFDQFLGFYRNDVHIRNSLLFLETCSCFEDAFYGEYPSAMDRFLGTTTLEPLEPNDENLGQIQEIYQVYLAPLASLDIGLSDHPLTIKLRLGLKNGLVAYDWLADIIDLVIDFLYYEAFPKFTDYYDLQVIHSPCEETFQDIPLTFKHIKPKMDPQLSKPKSSLRQWPSLYSIIDPENCDSFGEYNFKATASQKWDMEIFKWFAIAGLEDLQYMI